MSVLTGIAPQALLELDGDTFDALQEELARAWTAESELLAQMVENYVNAHRSSGQKAHRVPRPFEDKRQVKRVSIRELAGLTQPELIDAGGDGA